MEDVGRPNGDMLCQQEFIVLDGAWFDDWDTQPSLTYVRNYIGSKHTPRIGPDGCTILVKLCQQLGCTLAKCLDHQNSQRFCPLQVFSDTVTHVKYSLSI